ncbi:DUF2334 domain-containing protein [Candidatus Woesearchaeota archaeon]|jgi:peptidoglycan/xylan/chitin deacetylase (PgdA/CDA1 family)|nr:DUF2334 domain-containing protein [Candidatus Woesearchaeota archaeon]MBT3538392.1 DUF2334 domain-containing protein [Candidatus Woesearchaeota archaeon]MBT4697059.1 DUF2334 domain-containing protein [Candidatus Woesearchaeota archaeon]MBT4716385.1 DUF2334 domain-containing protein [Candidatus Woesearchaeota archaeon]MBT7106061.1 DUF2334 domain-containing protein [Candidatus Woesearchaeota archaeon]
MSTNQNLGIVLRVDNVLKPGTYENFKAMMDVINSKGATAVIDVTPKWHGTTDHDPEYVAVIKNQLDKGHVLALHGVEHRCRILQEHEHKVSWLPSEDEFDCKDYHRIHGTDIPIEIQREWLREGNQLLEKILGQRTDLLMPPAHAFNSNTLAAMKEEGFVATSDYGRWDARPYQKDGIWVLPFDFEDYMKNTDEDGGNAEAIFKMYTKYFEASVRQQGFYAMFTHCDFSGEGNASPERLKILDRMITYAQDKDHRFIDPREILR